MKTVNYTEVLKQNDKTNYADIDALIKQVKKASKRQVRIPNGFTLNSIEINKVSEVFSFSADVTTDENETVKFKILVEPTIKGVETFLNMLEEKLTPGIKINKYVPVEGQPRIFNI